jgi:hypothetical protein
MRQMPTYIPRTSPRTHLALKSQTNDLSMTFGLVPVLVL